MQFKKAISIVLCLSLLFSVMLSQFSFNVSAATVKVAYINGSGVNVRKSASTSSEKLETISYRRVIVTGTKKVGESEWLKVTYKSNGETVNGYIFNNDDYVYMTSYDPDAKFSTQLENFPTSYHTALKALNKKFPHWTFIPDYVNTSFTSAVNSQMDGMRKQVSQTGHPISWRSMGKGSYDWDKGKWVFTNGGWTGASKQVISYYMDPRNFLTESAIYMFLEQSYSGNYTEEALKKIVAGTFLEKGYSDPDNKEGYNGSYIKLILDAGKQSGVSPYVIASKIIQEQGTCIDKNGKVSLGSLISGNYSGYKGYYNFFNFNASGSTTSQVITNGLKYAKTNGWNTRAKSIIGGAKLYSAGYIELGQDSYYYQDFNVHFPNNLWHQYAQAVHDAYSKGYSLGKFYTTAKDLNLVFRIPIYKSMPTKASPRPVENSKHNNYYFDSISVRGLTPSFYRYTYSYDLSVSGDTIIDAKYPSTASLVEDEFSLKKGDNTVVLKVKSQTGYTNSYTISVYASKACNLYVNKKTGTNKPAEDVKPTIKKGDINEDGKITVSDMANVRLHLLKKYTLSGNAFFAADVNNDSKITISDMANIRLHLLGKYTIK